MPTTKSQIDLLDIFYVKIIIYKKCQLIHSFAKTIKLETSKINLHCRENNVKTIFNAPMTKAGHRSKVVGCPGYALAH